MSTLTRTSRGSHAAIELDTDRLDALLGDLTREHETLLDLSGAHREAIAKADPRAIGRVIAQTGDVLERIAQIETDRQQMVAKPDGSCATINEILPTLDPEPAERIGRSSARLRSLIGQLREEQEAVREASNALALHMQGLAQQVASRMSHAGTYGRCGAVNPTSTQITSSMDLRQ